MNNIKILAHGIYLPKNKITNYKFNEKFNLEDGWIEQRTGIKSRYHVEDESLEEICIKAAKQAIEKAKIDQSEIDLILVATTSSNKLMPGLSFKVQSALQTKKSICLDILAGCSGYINVFDIARKYIALGEVSTALIIGAEIISKYLDFEDVNTSILLGDGAGATILQKTDEKKMYVSCLESEGDTAEILTCNNDEKLFMNGKSIYKYAVTRVPNNITELLEKASVKMEEIKYIIPHQSNLKILKSISERLGIEESKMYINLKEVGNTFCASIPIALNEMMEKDLIKENDKIILAGYGGGLNQGSILLEI